MKIVQIAGGIILIALALFISFGITVYSLKEGDEQSFFYLLIPLLMAVFGIKLIVKRKN